MEQPRFLLDKDSICYGCLNYKHWKESDDPNYWIDKDDDMDEYGGVCDTVEPCYAGNRNTYRIKS